MNGKIAFVVGAGVGYVLGTRAGREQYARIKEATKNAWQNPKVQEQVNAAEERVGSVMREQGSQMAERATGLVKDRLSGRFGSSHSSTESGSAASDTPGPGTNANPEPGGGTGSRA
ncbi:YtxH domain-containing protein [Ruania suaedae]|uniref:YtxH domain-containing protein n=1 Tax=Ruania suaedae TaxID=2897774 RepID=UPI001E2FEC7C|nr:YtxH domain-containing protein [Ruania suaedae]UFU03274.1 YtxH domain-containing protein [Ruania suaedae]